MKRKEGVITLDNGHYPSGVPFATSLCPKCSQWTLRTTCYGNFNNENVVKVEDCAYCHYQTENSINGFKVNYCGRLP